MSHLVIVDGHHLMYRAYWAIPRTLTTKSGEQVNTIFGMASMLISILKAEEPTHLVVCFDEGEETFRHEENETYKDGRAETPDDFYAQLPRVNQLIKAFSFPHTSNPKYEADDFLGTYATLGAKEGMKVTIVTGDRDAFQLASDNIRIAIPHSGYQKAEYLGPEEIMAKYGIRPDQVPAYKGLIGDSSDNLPGVKGIGPKTAEKLLQEYDTLENIYDHIDDIKGSTKDKLIADREQAFFCQRMAELICDVPLTVPLKNTALESLPADAVLSFFKEVDFSLLTRRFMQFLQTPYGQEIFVSVGDIFAPSTTDVDESQLQLF